MNKTPTTSARFDKPPRVVVVGGGIGGLVVAMEAAKAGAEVFLYERSPRGGGKIYAEEIDGKRIDMGPTVLTMRWVFDLVFQDVGLHFGDEVRLRQADVIARHAWASGGTLDLFCNEEQSREAIQDLCGPKEADGFIAFSRYARQIYDHAYRTFLAAESPSLRAMAAASGFRGLLSTVRIDAFRTMMRALRTFFNDSRLVQLFGRYATYYGASPYQAPATLHLIAEVERQGVWLPIDGMPSVAEAVQRAAASFGAMFHFNRGVSRIETRKGRASGVVLDDETYVAADAVVFNGDAQALASEESGVCVPNAVRKRSARARSLSALVTGFVARTEGLALSSHNVFFPDGDYRREFDDIFRHHQLPSAPAVYVRAQDRDGTETPPEGERIFTIMNAPPVGDRDEAPTDMEIDRCINAQAKLFERVGLKVTRLSEMKRIGPTEFSQRYPNTGGALYGPSTHSPFAALRREGVRTRILRLYLTGGSIHPGAGVPMAALSGRQAARAVLSDLGLNAPSPLRDMPGGMLMSSATTGREG